jgi:cytochrome c oxidase subunit 3
MPDGDGNQAAVSAGQANGETTALVHGRHVQRKKKVPFLAMWLAVSALSMMFGALTILYLVRLQDKLNYPFEAPHSLWISTFFILASSLTLWLGTRAIRRGDRSRLFFLATLTLFFGVLFLFSQGVAWVELVRAEVFTAKNPFRDLFYIITAVHGAHVLFGVGWLGVVVYKSYHGSYTKDRHLGVELFDMYWHFMGIVWIVFFAILMFL